MATASCSVSPHYLLPSLLLLVGPCASQVQFGFVHMMHSSWWDALAPYNTTAKPILATAAIPRQPAKARTNANMNTAVAYALLRLSEAYLPDAVPGLLAKFARWKLDPNNKAQGTTTPAGIGNKVAAAWIKAGQTDGFNRLGDKLHSVNRRPYADYIGFIGNPGAAVNNDAYTLRNITAWQPLLETNGLGWVAWLGGRPLGGRGGLQNAR